MPDEVAGGLTVWLTGLPGAGKTTSSTFLRAALEREGYRVTVLDGDVMRAGISSDLGFSKEDRDENVRRAGEIALLLASQGVVVVVSLVSPRRGARDAVRAKHRDASLLFLEVHVAAPLEVCEQRDPKGLYRRARSGTLAAMTGVDDPYEPPLSAEIVLATHELGVQETGSQLVEAVRARLGGASR
jgi:adenylyl-sulfate kinase